MVQTSLLAPQIQTYWLSGLIVKPQCTKNGVMEQNVSKVWNSSCVVSVCDGQCTVGICDSRCAVGGGGPCVVGV